MLRGIIHYGLHFIAPYLIAYLWGRSRQVKAYFILLCWWIWITYLYGLSLTPIDVVWASTYCTLIR